MSHLDLRTDRRRSAIVPGCHSGGWPCDGVGVMGRVVLVVTCLVVGLLAGWFAMAQWEQANRVATVTSALGAVAAVGVAVWAVLRGSSVPGKLVRASRTGKAISGRQGSANTGVRVARGRSGRVVADRTGDADSSGGGDANTGVRLD
jgi:hypothetical protein